MKVLDVHGFQAGLEEIQQNLRTLNEQVLELEQAVQRIIGLEEALKGNGGDSIRQYYQQIHQTFLIFFQSFIANYDKIIEKIGYTLHTLEPAENGWIHESFVDENVQFGLRKIQSITESLTHETNDVMASVEDLVYLPRLRDEATQFGIQQAKDQAKRAIEQLHLFDQQATRSLEPIEKDIQKMTVFIQQAEAIRGDQDILIHFEPVKLLGQSGYLSLMGDSSPFTEEEEQNLRDYLIALEKGEVEPNLKGEYPDDFTMENNIFPYLPGKEINLDPKLKAILALGFDIIAGDALTIINPDASLKDKAIAAAMMLPPAKGVKVLSKVKDLEELVDGVGDVSKGIDHVKQGDKSFLAPGGGLATHEAKGGHLIERHVGKTDEELLERLKSNSKITGSSTFKDRMTAEKVANTVLNDQKNIEKIQKWLSDPKSRPTLQLRYKGDGEIIGRSVSRNSEEVENVTSAKIVLKKDNNGSFILTGYPVK